MEKLTHRQNRKNTADLRTLQKENDLLNNIYNKCLAFIYPKPAGSYGFWTKLQFAEATKL